MEPRCRLLFRFSGISVKTSNIRLRLVKRRETGILSPIFLQNKRRVTVFISQLQGLAPQTNGDSYALR